MNRVNWNRHPAIAPAFEIGRHRQSGLPVGSLIGAIGRDAGPGRQGAFVGGDKGIRKVAPIEFFECAGLA
jgi:hypothetical protein